MSHGALSAEAHETVAIALNRLGARANSGEGGEDPARAIGTSATRRSSRSPPGRFGVTAEYAVSAEELQIKIAQGSKPGEGGQIPAHKVTTRRSRVSLDTTRGLAHLAAPHHDITRSRTSLS